MGQTAHRSQSTGSQLTRECAAKEWFCVHSGRLYYNEAGSEGTTWECPSPLMLQGWMTDAAAYGISLQDARCDSMVRHSLQIPRCRLRSAPHLALRPAGSAERFGAHRVGWRRYCAYHRRKAARKYRRSHERSAKVPQGSAVQRRRCLLLARGWRASPAAAGWFCSRE